LTRPEHQRTSSQTSHSTPSQHRRSLSASEPSPSSPTMGDDDEEGEEENPTAKVKPKKRLSGVGKVFGFGKLNYAMKGIIDVDPETTRRNNIGKTKEAIAQVHTPPPPHKHLFTIPQHEPHFSHCAGYHGNLYLWLCLMLFGVCVCVFGVCLTCCCLFDLC
jgi:hypothetical protein